MAKPQTTPARADSATTATNGKVDPHEETGKGIVAGWIDAPIEFSPFGKQHKITLTPRRVIQFFARPTRSGSICSYEQAMKFCQLCKSRGLDPWEGDAYIVGYDTQDGPEFNLVTAHQAFLKRAEACPEFDGMESGVVVRRTGADKSVATVEYQGDYIEPGDILVGGWARVYRNDRKVPTYRRLNLDTFNKKRSRWNSDPAGMIVKCAEADALRSTFPNKIGGMYSEEEAELGFAEKEREPVKMPKAIDEPTKPTEPPSEPEVFGTGDPDKEAAELASAGKLFNDGNNPAK